ncbi:hypothetical protein FRC12_020508 [Ceratobasidium sp. 428]|nr:hypothetical protein FRC12_020508 [Ceratobasidium sp. 428]
MLIRKGRLYRRKVQISAIGSRSSWSTVLKPHFDENEVALKTGRINRVSSWDVPEAVDLNCVSTLSRIRIQILDIVKRLRKNTSIWLTVLTGAQQWNAADFACEQLSMVSKEQDDAERVLETLRQKRNPSVKETSTLYQQIDRLKQRIGQMMQDVACMSHKMSRRRNILDSAEAQSR